MRTCARIKSRSIISKILSKVVLKVCLLGKKVKITTNEKKILTHEIETVRTRFHYPILMHFLDHLCILLVIN